MRRVFGNRWLILALLILAGGFAVSRYGTSLRGALSGSGRFYYFTPQESAAGVTILKGKYSVMSCAGKGSFRALDYSLKALSGSLKFRAYQYPRQKDVPGAFLYSEAALQADPSLRTANTLTQFQRGGRYYAFSEQTDLRFSCGSGLDIPYWWIPELGVAGPRSDDGSVTMQKLLKLSDDRYVLVWVERLNTEAGQFPKEGVYASVYTVTPSAWSQIFTMHETTPGMVPGAPLNSSKPIRDLQVVLDGFQVLAAWSERAEWNVPPYHAAAALYARVLDTQALQQGPLALVWSAERIGGDVIGIEDNAPEKNLIVSARPFNIVWGDRLRFMGKFGQGRIPNYEYALHSATLSGGVWSERIFGQGEINEFLQSAGGTGVPALFWSYWPAGLPIGCQNQSPPLWMSMRRSDDWIDALTLGDASWYGFAFMTNASGRGVITYVQHCELGGYVSTNTLRVMKIHDGVVGPPVTLESVDRQDYRGWGEVAVTETAPDSFHIIWSAPNVWTPKEYTVTVP